MSATQEHFREKKAASDDHVAAGVHHQNVEDSLPTLDYASQPFYRKPISQVILLSVIFFLCPGMFNALSGLGGGGMQDAKTVDNGNVALYSTFAVFGFFGGSICNKLGIRWTLWVGTLGYGVYMASLYSTTQHAGEAAQNFVVAAGALLGICAGLLWTAQGAVMLSYATEQHKGKYIAVFWGIFNFGAVIGAIIPLARNWNRENAAAVTPDTYIVFIVLCFVGSVLPFVMSKPEKVVLPTGKPVSPPRHPTWISEFKGLWLALKLDPSVVLLFPMFFASNYFYTYQFNAFNGSGYYNIQTRSINNLCYWFAQIVGSAIIGTVLDMPFARRRYRALGGWLTVFTFVMVVFAGDYVVQQRYTRDSVVAPGFEPITPEDSVYPGLVWLYIMNGILDAFWQVYTYWLMGALSNDPRKLAYLAGWYKGLQSAGAAIAFRVDALKTPFMVELASTWGLCAGVMIIALPEIYLRVTNHTQEAEADESGDLKPVV